MDKKVKKDVSTKSKKIEIEEIEDIEDLDDDISDEVIKKSPKKAPAKTVKKNIKKTTTSKKKDKEFGDSKISLGTKIACLIVVIVLIILLLIKGCNKEKIEYTVKFDTNGGNEISEQIVLENDTVEIPQQPTREGYEFIGWYVGDEKYDFDSEVTSDIELEAKWQEIKNVSVTGVNIEQKEISLAPGGSATIVAKIEPSDAKDKSVVWTSSDNNVVTIDENGNIKAIGVGTATITVTTKDGGYKSTTVVKVSKDVVKVEELVLNTNTMSLVVGEQKKIDASVKPSDATNKTIIYESSNDDVAIVSGTGTVTAKSAGTTTISLRTQDGDFKGTVKVTVKEINVTGVTLTNNKLELVIGKTGTLKATVIPNNATNKKVTWKSSDESVATVNSNGVVTAKGVGTATITVTTEDGNKTKTATVTVKAPPQATSVSLNKTSLTLTEGNSETLKAKVLPNDAINKNVTWKSSDTGVATVTNGKVTAVKPGTATITVTTSNGKTATCSVTVNEKVRIYSYNVSIYQKDENSTKYYRVKVYNDNNQDVTSSVQSTSIQGSRINIEEGYIQVTETIGKKYEDASSITVTVNGKEYKANKK